MLKAHAFQSVLLLKTDQKIESNKFFQLRSQFVGENFFFQEPPQKIMKIQKQKNFPFSKETVNQVLSQKKNYMYIRVPFAFLPAINFRKKIKFQIFHFKFSFSLGFTSPLNKFYHFFFTPPPHLPTYRIPFYIRFPTSPFLFFFSFSSC